MFKRLLIFIAAIAITACASHVENDSEILGLKNFQVNTPNMLSSGLPNKTQFEILKNRGVTKVIDLIPGDRSEEQELTKALDLAYFNIQVEWQNPTLENFKQYVSAMQQTRNQGKTLTHCKLNWRGATFTYLYRVTQLGHSQKEAKKDMLAIWQPNDTWQRFIDDVLTNYK